MKPKENCTTNKSTGYSRSEPLHDMKRCLDQLHSKVHHHSDAQEARAYTRQQQPAQFPRMEDKIAK
uniref:Uncharacterized protein LOC103405553 n=1 Tax=Rhizophora mucronata TaxID=61149 RepID=A0A2P2IMU0_RHIMU